MRSMTPSTRLCSRRGWWLMAARSKISKLQAGEAVSPVTVLASYTCQVTHAKSHMHAGTKSRLVRVTQVHVLPELRSWCWRGLHRAKPRSCHGTLTSPLWTIVPSKHSLATRALFSGGVTRNKEEYHSVVWVYA
jgi:hypothetical protein